MLECDSDRCLRDHVNLQTRFCFVIKWPKNKNRTVKFVLFSKLVLSSKFYCEGLVSISNGNCLLEAMLLLKMTIKMTGVGKLLSHQNFMLSENYFYFSKS